MARSAGMAISASAAKETRNEPASAPRAKATPKAATRTPPTAAPISPPADWAKLSRPLTRGRASGATSRGSAARRAGKYAAPIMREMASRTTRAQIGRCPLTDSAAMAP